MLLTQSIKFNKISMNAPANIKVNENGGYFAEGEAFSTTKWMEIIAMYEDILEKHGKCTCKRLAAECCISSFSARKAINAAKCGTIPSSSKRGHGKAGVGSLKKLEVEHHGYLYSLYLRNPSRPRISYVHELRSKYGIRISEQFVTNWFKSFGNYKGSFRLTSKFPNAKDSPRVKQLLIEYLTFVSDLDHRRLVFCDEKPFKGVDIFDRVRRDPLTGIVPELRCDANSKNRYNVLAAVSLKKHIPICYRVVDETGDALLFSEFVSIMLREGILCRGDIFIVDNCTIHMGGSNRSLQTVLLQECGILMIPLPPYCPELNPTELVFRTLITRLRSLRCRCENSSEMNWLDEVKNVLSEISYRDVKSFFRESSYYK